VRAQAIAAAHDVTDLRLRIDPGGREVGAAETRSDLQGLLEELFEDLALSVLDRHVIFSFNSY
jgi:hypothetical protein